MTREAIGANAQFILWPESATPLPYEQDCRRGERSGAWRARRKMTMLIGSDQVEPVKPRRAGEAAGRPRMYNAAYLIQPDGSTAADLPQDPPGAVRRVRAVQAACCISSGRWWRPCPPSRPAPRRCCCRWRGHMASTAICYEVIYSGLMRSFVDARQRAADDDHQRRVVRLVFGRLPALATGIAAVDRAGALPGARRQHRHQRVRRSLRPGHAAIEHVPERRPG